MTRLSAPQLAITVSFSRLHPICNSATLSKQDLGLQRPSGVFHQHGEEPAVQQHDEFVHCVFCFTVLDVVCWASVGCKDTHVKSGMVLECAVVAGTTAPFLQI